MKTPSLEKVRLVGGYLPQPLAEKLGVMSLYLDISRSDIIRTLLEKQLNEAPPVAKMLDEVALRLFHTWSQTTPLQEYLSTVIPFLENKKLSDGHVVYVLQKIEALYNAQLEEEHGTETAESK